MTFNFWNLIRPLSASLLIIAFLVLSYCPLRRTIQNLIKGTYKTEQAGNGQQAAPVVCQGIIDRPGAKFTIPQPNPGISIPKVIIIVLSLFYPVRQFPCSEKGVVIQQEFLVAYLNSVPIYLRNRILLI